MPFKIKDISEPVWPVEFPEGALPNGNVREYDPWKLQQDLFDNQEAAKSGQEVYDGIRKAFGLPSESEAAESGAFTFTRNQCLAASAALGEFIDSLPVSKKTLSRLQKLSDSSASPSRS